MLEKISNLNHLAILELIRKEKEISRADIAKKVNLTPASITKITKKLIAQNILKESKIGTTSGGRPPILLTLNSKAGYVIGINLAPGYLEGTVGTLKGELKEIKKIDLTKDVQKEEVLLSITVMIDHFMKGYKDIPLYGIGLAFHGLVDSRDGVSIYAPYYGWNDFNIKKLLQMKYHTNIKVDNDVNAMAIGQKSYLRMKEHQNFILVNLSEGIGASIVNDNMILRGSGSVAGEIGHIVVSEKSSRRCKCGKLGCLETYISHGALLDKAKEKNLNFKNIDEMLSNGGIEVQKIVDSSGKYLGKVLGDLVNIINPEYIYLIGELAEKREDFIKKVEDEIKKSALEYSRNNLKVEKITLGSKMALLGAVTMVIDELFTKK
ncbi:ROK family transcriptional regulator [Psychrilyobacter sp.]|uniref:ROK family transcriptional regulator n=1 Tax=Psychrilyobacter sp. TaxID=2586924 RepID=UPI003017445F